MEDAATDADVCIVGSGFAGGLLAGPLLAAGLRVVMLEAGGDFNSSPASGVVFSTSTHTETVAGYQPLTTFRFVGGHSALWGGLTLRLSKGVFAGESRFGAIPRWPIQYDELEPYYDRAEDILVGSHHLREADQRPAIRKSPYLARLSAALEAEGDFAPYATPYSRLRLATSVIPMLESQTRFRLLKETVAVAIEMDSRETARSVRYRRADGTTGQILARSVVVAGGAIQTPRLLLLSRSAFHRDGIGNDNGLVGRYFADHFQVFPSWLSVSDASLRNEPPGFNASRHWKDRAQRTPFFVLGTGIHRTIEARDLILSERVWGARLKTLLEERCGTLVELRILGALASTAENRVDLDPQQGDEAGAIPRIRIKPNDADLALVDSIDLWIRRMFSGFPLRRLQYAPDGGAQIGKVGRINGGHLSGSCRMGDDPRASVVDSNLCVHGTRNVFVSGAATFVTPGAENPTLTISALTLRLGDHLIKLFQSGAV